jgi:hypothetical protein
MSVTYFEYFIETKVICRHTYFGHPSFKLPLLVYITDATTQLGVINVFINSEEFFYKKSMLYRIITVHICSQLLDQLILRSKNLK